MGQQEAQRIAEANEGRITYHDADWSYFEIEHQIRALGRNGKPATFTVTSHFEWVEFRYEGF